MDPNQEREVKALITLLEDPDTEIFEHVFDKLSTYGRKVIPSLENAWETSFNPELQDRIEELIHKIQFDGLYKELKEWARQEPHDLLKGAILISQYQYPELDVERINDQINSLRNQIWLELNQYLSPLEEVNIMNHILYTDNAFSGKPSNTDPHYYFLRDVLESKKGNAISLGIIYLILAQSLDLTIYGVNLPHHFVLAYSKFTYQEMAEMQHAKAHVHFYVNPLNKGWIFTYNDITDYLKRMELSPNDSYFIPCDNKTVIRLLVEQLIQSFEASGNLDKKNELMDIRQMLL